MCCLLAHTAQRVRSKAICIPSAFFARFSGCGKLVPDTKGFVKLDNGTVVPCGKQTDAKLPPAAALLYNEFIVYDTAQVKMKYLLKMKFHYK